MDAARWTLRVIGGLLVLAAASMLLIAFVGGPAEIAFGVLNAALFGGIGVGLARAKEGAWIVAMMLAGITAAFALAFLIATGDPMVAISFALNAFTLVALIWAGRQLPAAASRTEAFA